MWQCDVYEYSAEADSVTCLASYAIEDDPDAEGWVGSSLALTGQPAFVRALRERRDFV